jgi:hypothetical protein
MINGVTGNKPLPSISVWWLQLAQQHLPSTTAITEASRHCRRKLVRFVLVNEMNAYWLRFTEAINCDRKLSW